MTLERGEQRGTDGLVQHGWDNGEILDVEGHAAVANQPNHTHWLEFGVGGEGGSRVGERDTHLVDAGNVPADGLVQLEEQFGRSCVLLDRQSHLAQSDVLRLLDGPLHEPLPMVIHWNIENP